MATRIPSYRAASLLNLQLCTVESIVRRQHGTLLQRLPFPLSQSALCSPVACARFAAFRLLSSQPGKRPLDVLHGSWKLQRRSSSTNGPSRLPDTKSTNSNHTQTTTTPPSVDNNSMTMWQKFLAPKPMPERYSASWYREVVLICTVFAITGSSTMLIVRPAVSEGLGIKGNFVDGPWSYRICSIVIMTPIYATLLVAVGTIFGRHAYFRHFSVKIFSRFGIPPELMDPTYSATKRTFRKW